jgi:hypothetical protein
MNLQVYFKGIDKSDIAESSIKERILPVIEKFPELRDSPARVTLEMLNSPQKPGVDMFSLVLDLKSKGIIIRKSSPNMYSALADLCEAALERINRDGDKKRVKGINQRRKFLKKHEISDKS